MNHYCQVDVILLILANVYPLSWTLNYTDYCDYRLEYHYQCGDICLLYTDPSNGTLHDSCTCGDQVISGAGYYCCISPSDFCYKTEAGAECPNGRVLTMHGDEPCHERCYNDYVTSNFLGTLCAKE